MKEGKRNERSKSSGSEERWTSGQMDFWGPQSRYMCGFLKPRFSRSLEGELDWKSWREASGWRMNTRKKPPKVGLRQWWADERVGRETTYSGAKGWESTRPRTRCWTAVVSQPCAYSEIRGQEAEIREEPGKLTDGKDITHKHIPHKWVAHVRGTK